MRMDFNGKAKGYWSAGVPKVWEVQRKKIKRGNFVKVKYTQCKRDRGAVYKCYIECAAVYISVLLYIHT